MYINEVKGNNKVTFADLQDGSLFKYNNGVWMKAFPHGFINNSSVLKEVLERGDGLAVEMKSGKVTAWTRTAAVQPLISELNYWNA